MNYTKDTIPITHIHYDGQFTWLKCPKCSNTQKFTVLIQYQLEGGIPNPKNLSISAIEDDATHIDYNTVICGKCSFYLTWGGARWRTLEDQQGGGTTPSKTPLNKEAVIKSIPLDILEAFLKQKQEEKG